MAERLFRDRRDAGRMLARLLEPYRGRSDVIVLALPRGGVPVAYQVAKALDAPLDVLVVRKLGVPGQEELAMGAIAGGGVVIVDDDVVRGLRLDPEFVQRIVERERRELVRREQAYREGRPPPDVTGKVVIVVDDGLATGASMRAAVIALQERSAARIVVAVPAAPASTCRELRAIADEVVCATTPSPFVAVGQWYWDFRQVLDEEVRALLRQTPAQRREAREEEPPDEAAAIRSEALPRRSRRSAGDAVVDLCGDAHFVLLGEASHGTHEFYEERAEITRRLIAEKGFTAVAIEGDWPDAYRVNRFVHGRGADQDAEEALRGFQRFPTWMWRNTVVLDFVGWLRERNDRLAHEEERAGFYGLDLYGLFRSMEEIVRHLERVDPAAAERARERFACFDHYAEDAQNYAYAAAFGAGESCEREVIEQLTELQRTAAEHVSGDGLLAGDERFNAEMNARAVKDGEEYYRTMFGGSVLSWNRRDVHMADTLDALAEHLGERRGEAARIVVWAHNSHVGDSRATERGSVGELTLGRLARERHPGDTLLSGFTTHTGTVTAADDWGQPAQRKTVRPSLQGSVEQLFHDVAEPSFVLPLRESPLSSEVLLSARLERAIGVIYRPDTERESHYFRARVADQFDMVFHIDETRALEPLERTAQWERGDVPATFPHAV
ncbi:MAG TPA: erythromycin esterase family protein [Candidatus Dormibacteraeota bacterium]|jgi:erythromycin esterase-like protein/orotate phosphoribosyltransferase|nr:erythromycin esterase family protein [Candidatus Dormibacteraeota bacterium]